MFFSALFFLLGIMAVQQLSVLPDAEQCLALLALLGMLVVMKCRRLLLFVSGFLWAVVFAEIRMHDIMPESLQGKEIEVQGYIDGLPQPEDNRVKFDLVVIDSREKLPERLRLSWYFPEVQIKAGQFWRLTVKLKRPHGLFNPGAFDYERWLFGQDIGAVGYVRPRPAPQLLGVDRVKHPFSYWRQSIVDHLKRTMQGSRHLALVQALTVGDRSAMTPNQWAVLRKTGTVHLVAISGLHIGLVAGLVYLLAAKLWACTGVLSVSPQRVAAVCALFAATVYAALAGFSLPTRRALIMLTVALLAIYRQRHMTPLKTLAFAVMVVLVLDPLAVLSASFWLSFLAVLWIIFGLSARIGRLGYWRSLSKIHWMTALGLAPVIMLHFQQVSIIAPLTNLLAVPVIAWLVVPLSLLAVVFLFIFPSFAESLLFLVDRILSLLWRLLSACADLPFAAFNTIQPPFFAVVLALLGAALLLAPKGIPARYLGILFWLPLMFVPGEQPDIGEIRLTVLDVGQGLSVVVETHRHVLLYDTGAKFSRQFDMGNAVVLPYLRFRGITGIDKLLVSHGDNDHSGGLASILSTMPVGQLIGDMPSSGYSKPFIPCRSGQYWTWDGVRFAMLAPPQARYFQQVNDNSCVLKISTDHHDLLLPGDIERSAEYWLTKRFRNNLASVLMVSPHHGSDTSSSRILLQAVDPAVVLISSGYHNRFSLPHRQVLQRYTGFDIDWLNTAEDGAISVSTERERLTVISSRREFGRYWNTR